MATGTQTAQVELRKWTSVKAFLKGNRLDGIKYIKNHPVFHQYWARKVGRCRLTLL